MLTQFLERSDRSCHYAHLALDIILFWYFVYNKFGKASILLLFCHSRPCFFPYFSRQFSLDKRSKDDYKIIKLFLWTYDINLEIRLVLFFALTYSVLQFKEKPAIFFASSNLHYISLLRNKANACYARFRLIISSAAKRSEASTSLITLDWVKK